MDWLPYLTQLSRCPGAIKYSGIYKMLPDPLQHYLDGLDKTSQGKVLKALARLSEDNGFDRAVNSVAEAVRRGRSDLDSLLALHGYLQPLQGPQKMDVSGMALPELPTFLFPVSQYDDMLSGKAVT